jgi:hypothetical protein
LRLGVNDALDNGEQGITVTVYLQLR